MKYRTLGLPQSRYIHNTSGKLNVWWGFQIGFIYYFYPNYFVCESSVTGLWPYCPQCKNERTFVLRDLLVAVAVARWAPARSNSAFARLLAK